MKYFFFLVTAITIFTTNAYAQKKQHKIVFDMSVADTASYSLLIRQVNNVLKVAPSTKIEVVFYGCILRSKFTSISLQSLPLIVVCCS